jgi:molecular chaperone HtpG
VTITPSEIQFIDNGIGMSKDEMIRHFWRAGSSGKNTPEARAAGVVGTFGIGAMANFGVASELEVLTEPIHSPERTQARAVRETLSATKDCIELSTVPPTGLPGTTVIARVSQSTSINVEEAVTYLTGIVRHLPIPLMINGTLVSQQSFAVAVPEPTAAWTSINEELELSDHVRADVKLVVSSNGEVWIQLTGIRYLGSPLTGTIILRQSSQQIQTFRSSFALARTGVSSYYSFGGIADLSIFEPTAGREALTTSSMQALQSIVSSIERYVSEKLSTSDLINMNTHFMEWVVRHKRFELCDHLAVRKEPDNEEISLVTIRDLSQQQPINYYEGSDKSIIAQYASDEQPLIIVSTRQPRRRCEHEYFDRFCAMSRIQDKPTVLNIKAKNAWSLEESGIAFRMISVLESDYFVKADVDFGQVSHGLPILVSTEKMPVHIVLNSDASSLKVILESYKSDFAVVPGLIKDFIRNLIFPKISSIVPSSTREGAEAFLRTIRQPRDLFELEWDDLGNLSEIWQDYLDGKLNLENAARRSVRFVQKNVQVVESSSSSRVAQVLPDVLENERLLAESQEAKEEDALDARPAITRMELESSAKLLTIEDSEPPLKGYRCFLALTDRVRQQRMDFFLQPHRMEVVWGGQKAMFVLPHHSEEFALYYDIQGTEVFSNESGGARFPSCTIVLKNQVYIPIPDEIRSKFIPSEGEKKRFEIRCDLLYIEGSQQEPTQ